MCAKYDGMIFTPHNGLTTLLILGGPKEEVLAAFKSSLPPQPSSGTWIVFPTWATYVVMCSQKLPREASAVFNSSSTYMPMPGPRAARKRSKTPTVLPADIPEL